MAIVEDRKAALSAELERSRSRIAAHQIKLAQDLNAPAKLKANFSRNRGVWITAAILVGLVIAKLPARTKKVVVDQKGKRQKELEKVGQAGIAAGLLKVAFDVSKPMLVRFGKTAVNEFIARRQRMAAGRPGPQRY